MDASATTGWVIDHASHGYRVAALKLDQQHAAETIVSCSAKQEPSPHKPQARDSMTCDKVCNGLCWYRLVVPNMYCSVVVSNTMALLL